MTLALSFGEQLLISLATAVITSVLAVILSWQAILRRKIEARVEAQIAYEFARKQNSFDDELLRRRELIMRTLEEEMLERLDDIMSSAYRARNTVRELNALGPAAEGRALLVDALSAEGREFQSLIIENRIRLSALSSFDEAHALKNALLGVLRAEQAGMPEGAALVESTFQDFDSAIQKVVEVEPQSGS